MLNQIKIYKIDNINMRGAISIAIEDVIINEDNDIISVVGRERRGFIPGQFQEVEDYLANKIPESPVQNALAVVAALWTQEVIDSYNQYISEQEI